MDGAGQAFPGVVEHLEHEKVNSIVRREVGLRLVRCYTVLRYSAYDTYSDQIKESSATCLLCYIQLPLYLQVIDANPKL
jgi:hypothetical protein